MTSASFSRRIASIVFALSLISAPLLAVDFNFTVNKTSDESDASLADNFCDTDPAVGNQNQCTLRAAIQEVSDNAPTTLHKIQFSVSKVTLASSLPNIINPTVIDGSGGGPRLELDGNGFGCFNAASGPGSGTGNPILPEANNTRFEHLVVHGCSGTGIDLNGHGYLILDSYIGLMPDGTTVDANTGSGIDVSASITDGSIPDLSGVPLPGELADLAAIVTFLVAHAGTLAPTGIVNNVVSGNALHGINIHGQFTATTIVFNNKVGLNSNGDAAKPNGTDGSAGQHGIFVNASAYMNFIGLDNIISGNNSDPSSDGVRIDTGAVPFPNFVLTNTIGASPNSTIPFASDLGNSISGIQVGFVRPTTQADVDTDPNTVVNPLGLGAIIGPGNIVGYNGKDSCGAIQINCAEGGILVTSTNTIGVKIFGNLVGIADPSGSAIDMGNKGDGINVVGKDIEVGGGTIVEGNLIGSNNRHGLVIRGGASTYNVKARSNDIGTQRGLEADFGNGGYGIWMLAGGNQIGGPSDNEKNTIAFNSLHAINFEGGGTTFGNLVQRNEIFEVAPGFMAIDHDQTNNLPDDTDNDPVSDRSASAIANYTNWQQNTVVLSNASASGVTWSLKSFRQTASDPPYRIEFYSSPAAGGAKTFLCEVPALTTLPDPDDPANPVKGFATGTAGCATAIPGAFITASVTDIKPTVPGEPDRPGSGGLDVAINNTSELSNAVAIPDEVHFSSATYTVAENAGTATITLQRVGTGVGAISVEVADLGSGTATAGVDYTFTTPTTVNWANADLADKTVTVTIANDADDESDETVNLTLQNATAASIGTPSATTLTITDDDAAPQFAISDATATEGTNPTIVFTVTKSGGTAFATSVNYAVTPGTAVTPGDYTASDPLTGTLNFAAADVSKTITLNVTNDTIFEPSETLTVTLTNPVSATISDPTGIGTITDDETQPTLSIGDVTALEGNAGTTAFNFTVTLSNASSQTITVNFATADGTATVAGADYAANSGTLTFNPGVLSQPITLNVNGDVVDEPDETFVVNLTVPSNATIADNQATGTIQNDDSTTPTFTVDNVTLAEGNAGSIAFTFTVSLSPAAASTVSVQAATADGTATVADADYAANTQTLTFNAAETTKTFVVNVSGDTKFEPNETFAVNLSANSAGTAISGSGTGTITNDDAQPAIAINDVVAAEGNAGTTAFTFTVSLSNPSSEAVTVNFATADGTATVANNDYAANSGMLTFAPGVVTQQVIVQVTGDTTDEPTETFNVNLTLPAGATIADAQGIGTISNDDSTTPTFSIDNVTAAEGNAGTTAFTFTVTLSPVAASVVTVQATTADGTATVAGADYAANTQTLTFNAAEATKTFTVNVNGDTTSEPNETFSVNLSANSAGTAIGLGTGTGTITNDDAAPTISIDDVSALEGNAGTTAFTFTVSLSSASSQVITVNFATADGTATLANNDYVANSGTVTFAPGVLTRQVIVQVNGDAVDEAIETFTVDLTVPANATIADAQGVGTILNDDSTTPTFFINDVTQAEGNAGTTAFIFTVTAAPVPAAAVTVQAATSDGTATVAGGDYAANSQTLTFNAGEAAKTFTVNVNGDTVVEPNETFTVTLSANSAGTAIGDGSGTGTITDDDLLPTVSISDIGALEGNAGATSFTFTVTLSSASAQAVTVAFATADGTATVADNDYTALSGQVTFAPGVVSQTVTVLVNGDLIEETDETFVVNLTNPSNATIADTQATATIINDDGASASIPLFGGKELAFLALLLALVATRLLRNA